jgi:hypothetical protein
VAHKESTESSLPSPQQSSPSGERESPLHESSNISLRALIIFVIVFVLVAVGVHFVVYKVFEAFRAAVAQQREITGVGAERIPPPEPRLEPSVAHKTLPSQDLERLRAAEQEEFARRGWVDEKTGEIRVPENIAQQIAEMSRPRK